MGFFKRNKSGKSEENKQSNVSDEKTPPFLVEMTIDKLYADRDLKSGTLSPLAPAQRLLVLKERKGDRQLPIFLGPQEADSIAVQLAHVDVPRPLTHDFLCAIIGALGARVKHVIISELKDRCFYAKTCLDYDGNLIEVDCRSSDAIAVAVRTRTPIFTTEVLLKIASVKPI